MLTPLRVSSLVLLGVTWALSLAHALEYPGKLRLDHGHYFAAQTIYYPGFTYAGTAEPLAIIVLAVLLVITPAGSSSFWLTVCALVAAVLTHALYWWRTAPVNRVWLKNESLTRNAERFFRRDHGNGLPSDWVSLRTRWEHSHLYRGVGATLALASILAILISR